MQVTQVYSLNVNTEYLLYMSGNMKSFQLGFLIWTIKHRKLYELLFSQFFQVWYMIIILVVQERRESSIESMRRKSDE